jgi:hypothetical protein
MARGRLVVIDPWFAFVSAGGPEGTVVAQVTRNVRASPAPTNQILVNTIAVYRASSREVNG